MNKIIQVRTMNERDKKKKNFTKTIKFFKCKLTKYIET